MKRSDIALQSAAARLDLDSRAERIWFAVTFALFIVYAELVTAMQHTMNGGVVAGLLGLELLVVPWLCWCGVKGCRDLRRSTLMVPRRTDKRRMALFTGLIFAVTFLYSMVWELGLWPGQFTTDSIWQYEQAVTGAFTNWHPVLQTWWTFSLPLLFFKSPASIIICQLVWWSLSVAYLFSVMYRMGCSRLLMGLSLAYILGNPNNMMIMITPWKDSAMAIFALFLFAQILQIFNDNGAWLKKWYNFAAFTFCAFMTAWLRHNGILLVAPVFVLLLIFQRPARKAVAASAAVFLGLTVLYQGPAQTLMHVEKPPYRVMETMGFPMTVLCNVYAQDKEALSQDGLQFMESLAPQEEFQANYRVGSFNTVKWAYGIPEKMEQEGAANILRYTLEAYVHSPKAALEATCALTAVVWCVDNGDGWCYYYNIEPNEFGITPAPKSQSANHFANTVNAKVSTTIFKYLFHYLGVMVLFMIALAVGSIGSGGLGRAFMVLSPLAYDFGTMLLLAEHDFRFFQFNFVIVVPLLVLMISRGDKA